MRKNRKSQVLIFSAMFLILLLLISYSLETRNSYKEYFSKSSIFENIKYESCQVGINSNGSYIDDRFSYFISNVSSYCDSFSINCSLTITKSQTAPIDLSLLNYTHYNYSIYFSDKELNYTKNYTC